MSPIWAGAGVVSEDFIGPLGPTQLAPQPPYLQSRGQAKAALLRSVPTVTIKSSQSMLGGVGGNPRIPTLCSLQGSRAGRVTDPKVTVFYVDSLKTRVWVCFLFSVYLAALGLCCCMQTLSCSMWALVPGPGMEPRPPALGTWSLSHWTAREVPGKIIFNYFG